jgi:hypothetical protein
MIGLGWQSEMPLLNWCIQKKYLAESNIALIKHEIPVSPS